MCGVNCITVRLNKRLETLDTDEAFFTLVVSLFGLHLVTLDIVSAIYSPSMAGEK